MRRSVGCGTVVTLYLNIAYMNDYEGEVEDRLRTCTKKQISRLSTALRDMLKDVRSRRPEREALAKMTAPAEILDPGAKQGLKILGALEGIAAEEGKVRHGRA